MRGLLLVTVLSGMACAQTMTEFGAAAAGGATGGAAGKKVSEGITSIFGKLDKQSADAAKQGPTKAADPKPAPTAASPARASTTTAKVAPGLESQPGAASVSSARAKRTAKEADTSQVPEPPDSRTPVRRAAVKKESSLIAAVPVPFLDQLTAPQLPAPPVATPEALSTLSRGASRADVLSLGFPSSRISMNDDGHLAEIFGYTRDEVTFAVVHLTDGVVSSIDVR